MYNSFLSFDTSLYPFPFSITSTIAALGWRHSHRARGFAGDPRHGGLPRRTPTAGRRRNGAHHYRGDGGPGLGAVGRAAVAERVRARFLYALGVRVRLPARGRRVGARRANAARPRLAHQCGEPARAHDLPRGGVSRRNVAWSFRCEFRQRFKHEMLRFCVLASTPAFEQIVPPVESTSSSPPRNRSRPSCARSPRTTSSAW